MASDDTLRVRPFNTVRCVSKKLPFLTHEDAHQFSEYLMRKEVVKPGCHITPYECQHCGWWHVYNRKITFEDDNS